MTLPSFPPYTAGMCRLSAHGASWSVLLTGGIGLLALALGACSSKTPQYPADHDRIRSIDRAVDALRVAYQDRNLVAFRALLKPVDQLKQLEHQVEADFEAFHTITLDFKIERILVEGDEIDVYIQWQGVWKKQAEETGLRQRGHARLQWTGTRSILLRDVQGDLPFGMAAKHALSETTQSRSVSQ